MANGPQDYRDPKVTTSGTTARTGSRNWLWYLIGAIVLLLLLGWLLGLFSAADDQAATDAVVVDEPAATGTATTTETPAATDDAAATDGAATTGGATTTTGTTEAPAD